jgi:outer membrane protein assembly factor BamB
VILRRAVPIVLLAGLTSGCSVFLPMKHGVASRSGRHGGKVIPVRVSVVDGDTLKPIRNAFVRTALARNHTNRHGAAVIRVVRSHPYFVTASARGYTTTTQRKTFHRAHYWRTLFMYRPKLQWPMYGAVARRTQAQEHIKIRPPLRHVWTRRMGGLIEFPSVVSDGTAYIANKHGVVMAISVGTGRFLWRRNLDSLMASSPAVVGTRLVVHDMKGRIWVLRRFDGRILHHYAVPGAIESSPVIRHAVDYFGAWNGVIYALDLHSGRFLWKYSTGYKITSSAAVTRGAVYIGDYGGHLLAFGPNSGRLLWQGTVNGRIYGTPAVSAGRVFVPSSDGGSLTAFSTGGHELWRRDTGSYVYSSPAVWGNKVFFGSYDGLLYCVSARSGSVLWTRGVGGRVSGAVVAVDRIAYASTKGRTIGVSARTGRVVFSFPHGDYVPLSGNGRRLLLNGYSRLYALEPRRR